MARAVRAVFLELRLGSPGRSAEPAPASPAPAPAPSRKSRKAPRKVAVVEGEQLRGKSFDLDSELTIGRTDRCRIVLDDPYVSSVHARIYSEGDTCLVEDLGSTNGTYLDRQKVTAPTPVPVGVPIRVGKTTLELRK